MGIAGAIAGVGAAATIGGSLINSSAAKSAASTQSDAATRAADLQLQEQQQVRGDLAPYNQTGQRAADILGSFYGINPSSSGGSNPLVATTSAVDPNSPQGFLDAFSGQPLTQTTYAPGPTTGGPSVPSRADELTMLENTPGYQFALSQGLKSTQNSAAARGLGTSGAALKGAAGFATGLAENTYQANLLNPLQSLAQLGESAAAQTGTLGTQGAANAGAGLVGAGNATAAGTVGAANATSGALSSLSGAPLNYLLYNKLLGNGDSSSGAGSTAGGFWNPATANLNYSPSSATYDYGGSTAPSVNFG